MSSVNQDFTARLLTGDDEALLRTALEMNAPTELCEFVAPVLPHQVGIRDANTGRLPLHVALVSANGKAVRVLLTAQPDTIQAQGLQF